MSLSVGAKALKRIVMSVLYSIYLYIILYTRYRMGRVFGRLFQFANSLSVDKIFYFYPCREYCHWKAGVIDLMKF